MKSICFVFISLSLNALCFAGTADSTYFMVHEQTSLAECENNLSSSLELSPQGELQPKNKAGGATQFISVKGGDVLRPITAMVIHISNRAEPVLSVPARVEAFYSQNQQMLQDWKVPYDNSLFVRLDQPGFISPYFSLLRARNLIVP